MIGVSLRQVVVIALTAALLVGCGSGTDEAVDQNHPGSESAQPLGTPSLASITLKIAVVDDAHALVVESRSGVLSAAGMADGKGNLRALHDRLPALGSVDVVGTADGYVIAGIRCEGSLPVDTSATENELLCSADPGSGVVGRAEPVAVRLDIDGRIRWTAVGRPVDPSRFGGLAPTRDGALLMSGDAWYTAERGTFARVDPPTTPHDEFTPCVLRDGRLVAFVADFDAAEDDASGGRRMAMVARDGGWASVAESTHVPAGALLTSSCTTGGLVARTQQFVHAAPAAAELAGVGLESVAGITDGGIAVVDASPRRLIDLATGSVVAPLSHARFVALSWDGRTLAQVTDRTISLRAMP
jgi:hypothetical protein